VAALAMISIAPVSRQFAKDGEQITFPFIDKDTAGLREQVEIKVGELAKLRMFAVPLLLTPRRGRSNYRDAARNVRAKAGPEASRHSVGVSDIVSLNGTESSTRRCIIRSRGM